MDPGRLIGDTTATSRATRGYGLARWLIAAGRTDEGVAELRRVVEAGAWPSFGATAAEADLARLSRGRS